MPSSFSVLWAADLFPQLGLMKTSKYTGYIVGFHRPICEKISRRSNSVHKYVLYTFVLTSK